MKPLFLAGSFILIIIILVAAVAFSRKDEIPEKHVEVVLREVGHRLLLSAGDSSSRVLPVKKVGAQTYQLAFQKDFGFISDSLINLVQRIFQKTDLADDYIVNLRSCPQNETIFAFEINNQAGDLTPCRGRTLEIGCYVIEIELLEKKSFSWLWLTLLIIPLLLVGYYVKNKPGKKEEAAPVMDPADYIQLGSFRFYAENNVLKTGNDTIPLSEKETKALKIFSENINQAVARERLMKEIWEDEGIVVISRNVDVLVSKLRKKLSGDEAIKIVNVPGRGYRFVVG